MQRFRWLTKMLTDGRTEPIHGPEVLCNPANKEFLFAHAPEAC